MSGADTCSLDVIDGGRDTLNPRNHLIWITHPQISSEVRYERGHLFWLLLYRNQPLGDDRRALVELKLLLILTNHLTFIMSLYF